MEWTNEQWNDVMDWAELHSASDLIRKLVGLRAAVEHEAQRLREQLRKDDVQMGELAVGGQKWIAVEDDSPVTPEDCLVVLRGHAGCGYLGTGDKWHVYAYYEDDGLEHDAEVTHWQPLPAPPSGEQGAKTDAVSEGAQNDE